MLQALEGGLVLGYALTLTNEIDFWFSGNSINKYLEFSGWQAAISRKMNNGKNALGNYAQVSEE